MIQPNLIPSVDPNPLPAPYWIFELLLIVTFVLHIFAVNFTLGGGVMALAGKWRSRKDEKGGRMFFDVAKLLPVLLPAAITLGVAPLLFVQVIYGQYLYTSSIVMAWPWFLVLGCLVVAYYGFYYVSFRSKRQPGKAGIVMLLSVVLVFLIGFVFSNNLTLSQTPARWGAKYFADPAGWNLNLFEPTLIPRYLHFFTAFVAFGGLLLVLIALSKWKRDREYAGYVFEFGGKAFQYATMAELLVGIWFLASLPRNLRMLFLGDNSLATILLVVGLAAALGAILVMGRALREANIRLAAYGAPALIALTILCMSTMRDLLRDAYLAPYFHTQQFAVKTQWSVFPLFLVIFVAGVILWFVMLKRYGLFAGSKAPGQTPVTGSQTTRPS
jgi:hypothetical protein